MTDRLDVECEREESRVMGDGGKLHYYLKNISQGR